MSKKTALYRHYDNEDKLLYIGISLSAMARLSQHNRSSKWASLAVKMTTEWFDSRVEALEEEKRAIQCEAPVYNITHNSKDRQESFSWMFHENISLLHGTMNKQTLFFYELASLMDKEQKVHLTPNIRREVITAIGSKTGKPLDLFRQMLSKLIALNLIAPCEEGAYMINPLLVGHSNVSGSIKEKEEVYIKLRYNLKDKERTISVG